ncbi:MAG: hypothetical protein MUC36_17835 [Planctomycetes bacterium]|jgi:hypothetical protein|nr:hypothetical protein [Planctomycetota bacterium]
MRLPSFFVLGLLAAAATAQTNILPRSANGVAGSATNAFPWGFAAATFPGVRTMSIYDSSHFTAAPVPITTPILITSIKWRANDVSTATSWPGGTYSNATLRLGTAAVDHLAATTNFAANVGPDYMLVYQGTVTVLPGTGLGTGVVHPYVVDIPVNPPFLYDPNAGDLVVDTDYAIGAFTGSTPLAGMDVHAPNVFASRVYATSTYPTANGVDANAPVIEVGYVPAPAGTAATNTSLGAGCVSGPDASFYELFTSSAAFDLANSAITLTHTGNGYIASSGVAAYLPPSAGALQLTLTDNSQIAVSLSQPMPVGRTTTSVLNVCSNGFITAGAPISTAASGTASSLLNNRAIWAVCWHNMNPTIVGSGQVWFEEVGGTAFVTWDGVWDNSGTTAASANTMQAQFDLATGSVTYVYGAISTGGTSRMVGFSDVSGSSDPGNMDISAALPATFTAATFRLDPLTLGPVSRPVLGTNWDLRATNVPPTTVVGIDVFGLTDPGLSDLAVIGMPTCGIRASLDVLNVWFSTGSVHAYSLPLPSSTSLINFHVFTSTVAFQPGVNAFGAITSNGIDGKLGDL